MTMQQWREIRCLAVVLFMALGLAQAGQAADRRIRVMGSSTDLMALAKEIARDRVEVYCPFPGYQEPELWVEEVFPSWAVKASRADIYIRIGLFADVWADTLITDARNPRIDPGAPGHVDASLGIEVLEIPSGPVDRSRGRDPYPGEPALSPRSTQCQDCGGQHSTGAHCGLSPGHGFLRGQCR